MASPTARPTMPSADFCAGVRGPRGLVSLVTETRRRPPEVSSIAFTAHPPDLQPQALDGYGLRDQLSARPTRAASYPISVRQVATLLHASFRPRLAATPLRFANTSPPSGCVGDLHPLAIEHAPHTTKSLRGGVLNHQSTPGSKAAPADGLPVPVHRPHPVLGHPIRATAFDAKNGGGWSRTNGLDRCQNEPLV
jgi:hypothetical protein